MVNNLAETINQIHCLHPLRVAIDGVDASGKTMLADELAEGLNKITDRQVVRASVDDFHHPEHVRRAKGSLSPEGFYYDSYDYDTLINHLLEPLGPNGNLQYRRGSFDYRRDEPLTPRVEIASADAILLMDGIFLLRPRLMPFWDLTIYIKAAFANTVARGAARDADLFGSLEQAEIRYQYRYVPGQQLYHHETHPLDKADILIDNNKIDAPVVLRLPKELKTNQLSHKFPKEEEWLNQ